MNRHEGELAGRVLDGKYRLVRLIGRGGMGMVWEAFHTGLDRRVAVKLLETDLVARPEGFTRFDREAKVLARFQSPYVVGIYDVGVTEGLRYLVMELLEGEDLGQVLARRTRLSLVEARAVFTPVLQALSAAHTAGIVHRDVKPSNIFLARTADGVRIKMLDFGVAKMQEASRSDLRLTTTGQLLGSPLFMSPEQVRGDDSLDHRSDLWSLGVVIYLALTGVPPFPERSTGELLLAIMTNAQQPASIFPGLDADADVFFARVLAKDPKARFSSADEMRAAFLALTGDMPAADLGVLLADVETARAAPDAEPMLAQTLEGPWTPRGAPITLAAPPEAKLSQTAGLESTVGPSEVPLSATGALPTQIASSPVPPADPWLGIAAVLPFGLRPHQDALVRFLRALFGRFEPESERVAQLFDPSFPAARHHRFFAVFLAGSAQSGLLATQTFIAQSESLEEHLGRLDKRARKVVLAVSDSVELGAGVRQRIFGLYRAYNALVVPLHISRLRAAVEDGTALDVFHEGLSDFHALPDAFAVGARALDPTSLFGMRVLVGELVRALEQPAMVSIWGPPGCGKTSLIEMARGELTGTRITHVRCVELTSLSIAAVAREIARALGDEGPAEEGVRERIARAAQAARDRAPGQRALVVLEDADVILKPLGAADAAERIAAQTLWTALGRASGDGLLSIVVTSLSGFILGEAKIAGWVNPLSNKARLLPIPPLSLADVRKMLTDLGLQINVRFGVGAVDYVYEVTAGNVYAVRKLCGYVVNKRRRQDPHGPLDELRVEKGDLVAGARDLVAIGETFNESVLPWLDDAERLVLEAVAVRRPRDVRGAQAALSEQEPDAVAGALDRLRRIGLVERQGGRERVAIPLLEQWARYNLRPAPGEAARRRAQQLRTLTIGLSITLLLVGGYALWSRSREATWEAGGCRYELDYPGRAEPGAEVKLYVFRTCTGPPGADDVRISARSGTLAQLGAGKTAQLVLHARDRPDWQQQEIPAVLTGIGRGRFELEVFVGDRSVTTLTLGYDWLAGISDLTRKLIAAASALPAALAALLAYGKELAALVRRVLGREEKRERKKDA